MCGTEQGVRWFHSKCLPKEVVDRVLARLADTTASVYVVPDFFVFELLHSRWSNIGGLPVVSVFENPFYGVDGMMKRVADLCLASNQAAKPGV